MSNPSCSRRLCREVIEANGGPPPGISGGKLVRHPERVIQFGEGHFLRGFADWMIDILNEQGLFEGSVVVVQPVRDHRVAEFQAQDGIYTVVLRGMHHGENRVARRWITSISRVLSARAHWAGVIEAFCQPGIRFVISNTTEAGIAWHPEPVPTDQPPESFPGKLAALLHERYRRHDGDPAAGLVFLPCELIERNGDTLCRFVLQHAEAWGLGPGFAKWIREANRFPNTLVDRIVTGFDAQEAARLSAFSGAEDRLLVAGEDFASWIIEAPATLAEALPLHRTPAHIAWVEDLSAARTRKVRLLNGAHTGSALAAFLGGIETVPEMTSDPVFGGFVRRLTMDEILPGVPGDVAANREYATTVLERFANPFVRHRLIDISLNSVSKWTVRVLPALLDFCEARGVCPPGLCFSLAALVAFYRGRPTGGGDWSGGRPAGAYPIRDDARVLECFGQLWRRFEQSASVDTFVREVLGQEQWWAVDLNRIEGLAATVARDLELILEGGTRSALTRLGLAGAGPV